jgi:hypothetical protein
VSTLGWAALGVLAAATSVSIVAWARTGARLHTVTARVGALEGRLAGLDVTTEQAIQTARAAAALARRAGPDDEPPAAPRVVLEPVTGRLVKALAWGAGARRVVTHLTHTARSGPR